MAPAVSLAMAPTSLLLFRLRLRPSASFCSYLIRNTQHHPSSKPFSSSPEPLWQPDPGPPLPPAPPPSDPKAGLSARMSFVFDQIDAMERMRGAKDEALQRIRAWRQTKQQQQEQQEGAGGLGDARGIGSEAVGAREMDENRIAGEEGMVSEQAGSNAFKKGVELVHPWPEWIELMELLVKQNYFDHRRFNEDQVVKDLPIDLSGIAEDMGFDFTRDWATVRTACLNFGRDRFDILRSLSKKDLQILVGHGCPSTDKKVVFSAKLLRKHAHLDEGDVCSACKLRSTCSSGYLATRKEDEARTLDLMRVLLTFAFDSINGSVENKALLKMKSLKTVARKLLHDIVKLGTVPIDPNLPLPVIKRPPPKVKQPPPPPKKRVGRDDVEMKKGDWLCPKCDFMNFAKNVVCLQCDAKRPKRQLLPGEWECPECNFLNYRRNMACFHCDHKRPPDEFTENKMQFKQEGPRERFDRTAGPKFSSGWNFDFDENESDGVDVAAFEFADPPRMSDGSVDVPIQRGATRGSEDNISEANMPRSCDSRNFSGPDEKAFSHVPRTGFDDFDDEDDDIDSYEIDDQHANPIRVVSAENVSKFESSGSEDFDDFEDDHKYRGSYNAPSSRSSDYNDQNNGFESESTGRPQWKTFSDRTSVSGRNNQNRAMSDDVIGLDSDFDDDSDLEFASKQRRGVDPNARTRGSERMRNSVSEDDLFGSESDDCDYLHSNGNKSQRNGGNRNRRGNYLRESDNYDSPINGMGSGTRNGANSFGNTHDGWRYGGPSRRTQGARTDGNHAQRGNNEKYGVQRFERPQKRQFQYRQGGESDRFNDRSQHSYEYRQKGESNRFNDRSQRSYEYRQKGESNRFNDRSQRSYDYRQKGESNRFNDRSRSSDEYRQKGESNRFNDRSQRSYEYRQKGESNRFIDRSRSSDEYRQRRKSNQWNNRSKDF